MEHEHHFTIQTTDDAHQLFEGLQTAMVNGRLNVRADEGLKAFGDWLADTTKWGGAHAMDTVGYDTAVLWTGYVHFWKTPFIVSNELTFLQCS